MRWRPVHLMTPTFYSVLCAGTAQFHSCFEAPELIVLQDARLDASSSTKNTFFPFSPPQRTIRRPGCTSSGSCNSALLTASARPSSIIRIIGSSRTWLPWTSQVNLDRVASVPKRFPLLSGLSQTNSLGGSATKTEKTVHFPSPGDGIHAIGSTSLEGKGDNSLSGITI
jgi:hypothetical protein